MSGEAVVQLVTILTGAIVTLASLWMRYQLLKMGREIDALRATIASTHALLLDRDSKK